MLDRFVGSVAQPWRWLPFGLRLRIARLRALVGRRRLLRRGLIVGSLAVFVAVGVSNTSALRVEQARWGTLVEVAVVDQSREVGDPVKAEHIRFESLPAVAVPDDAVKSADVLDAAAAINLRDGDVLRRRDLVGSQSNTVGDGRRAIAIPVGVDVPPLSIGHRVDVFVFDDAFGPVASSAVEAVSGSVVQLLEEAVVVSVDEAHARTVAAGIVNGRVLLAAA